ncbi:MAG TPA: helix-turn-helix domain-containing protein [Cyclobacteriaceae bacterium]|nr:helix-turn-helix domain-containing protein [Cyclobacteriaceae bacterium]HMX49303.1 helix-turn-helix domain-containing protein [Cyclobacteriaceae bacterium]HMY93625.1 helix-turn-helix domain-containing protein [Cyclobacteriaceae bacterium]HND40666.1 helix-turn-helix domain-containing protein [Cyclobacteriaceae bacterium]HNE94621.1 helix-turn-helix domain-containing protein [Cyclobacteriaceae bacterium]
MGDLEIFKENLIQEIKTLLASSTTTPTNKWLKSSEVKKLLGISTGTLQNLRINGTLSYSKIGGTAYYDYDEIAKLLKNNEQRWQIK